MTNSKNMIFEIDLRPGLNVLGRWSSKMIVNQTLSIVIATFVGLSSTRAQTTLISKWEIGKTLNYEIEDSSSTNIKGDDGDFFELSIRLKLDTTWKAEKVLGDGSVKLSVGIDRVRFSAAGKGAAAASPDLTFDSNKEIVYKQNPGKLVALVLKEYVGPVGTVTIDRRGGLTGFSASKDLVEMWKNSSELAGFYGDIFMLEGVRDLLTAWLVAFPGDSVPNGQTWNKEQVSRFGEEFTSVRNYKLIGPIIKDAVSLIQIDVTSKIKEAALQGPGGLPGIGIEQKITEKEGSGQVFLDNKTRHIRKFVLHQKLDVKSDSSDIKSKYEYSANLRQGKQVDTAKP